MARPPIIAKLRHGKILTFRVFRFFVETWNWMTAYVDNLRGDADVNPNTGYIEVDRTDPDAPVIRLRADKLPAGGGGAAVAVSADGPFSPIYEEDGEGEPTETVTGFQNCFWQLGGVTQQLEDQTSIPGTDGFIVLKAGATPSTSGTASLYCYSSLAALQAAQHDLEYFIVPLYRVASSKITLDMRRMPVVYSVETI